MKQTAARLVIETILAELDEDALLGSMLYCMSQTERKLLIQRLMHSMVNLELHDSA
jgi:hypothetical protein